MLLRAAEQPGRIEVAVAGEGRKAALAKCRLEDVAVDGGRRRVGQLVVLHQHLHRHLSARRVRSGRRRHRVAAGRQHLQRAARLQHQVVLQLLPLRLVAPVLEPGHEKAIDDKLTPFLCPN